MRTYHTHSVGSQWCFSFLLTFCVFLLFCFWFGVVGLYGYIAAIIVIAFPSGDKLSTLKMQPKPILSQYKGLDVNWKAFQHSCLRFVWRFLCVVRIARQNPVRHYNRRPMPWDEWQSGLYSVMGNTNIILAMLSLHRTACSTQVAVMQSGL